MRRAGRILSSLFGIAAPSGPVSRGLRAALLLVTFAWLSELGFVLLPGLQLTGEKKRLQRRLKALRDPGALEREARHLGMVRVGERSYVIENLP